MKRISYWFMSTVSVLVLLFGYHTSTSSTAAASAQYAVVTPATGSSPSSTSSSTSSSASSSTATSNGATSSPTSTPSSTSSSASTGTGSSSSDSTSSVTTTVTGTAAQTRYGPVQVELTLTGGKITAVDVVEYPDGNGRDQEINARALPILVSETLKAENASIDMVSGATYTSDGYTASLQSALDQAGL